MKKYLIILIGLAFLIAPRANAAITIDATSTSGKQSAVNTFTWSHTVGSGSNSVLIVVLQFEVGGSGTNTDSASWNGTAMTQAVYKTPSGDSFDHTDIFYLLNPTTGTHNVSTTLGTLAAGTIADAGAYSLFGVDQTTPIEASSTASCLGCQNATTTTTTLTANDWIIDSILASNSTLGTGPAANAGQTTMYLLNDIATNGVWFGSSYDAVGAASTYSTGWAWSGANMIMADGAVAVKPAVSSIAIPSLSYLGTLSVGGGTLSIQ